MVLLRLWTSDVWRTVWESLEIEVESFERLGLPYNTSDRDLWQLYQQRKVVLPTANRNDEGPDSLEATIRTLNAPSSLPVLTIADPELCARTKIFLYVKLLSAFADSQPSLFATLINKRDILTGAFYSKFEPRNSQLTP